MWSQVCPTATYMLACPPEILLRCYRGAEQFGSQIVLPLGRVSPD